MLGFKPTVTAQIILPGIKMMHVIQTTGKLCLRFESITD
jgi:hypothetical protein